jgi:hypothetical protein
MVNFSDTLDWLAGEPFAKFMVHRFIMTDPMKDPMTDPAGAVFLLMLT